MKKYFALNLQLFAAVTVTTDPGMSAENKTFYDMTLIDEASANLIHDQFGQKRPIPKNGGKTINFRKFVSLGKSLTPITEGVTPAGKKLEATNIEATVAQYGDFVTLSDMLDMTAIDPVVVEATKVVGRQAGLTLDTITRNVIQGGTNVFYAPKGDGTAVSARSGLDATCKLTVDVVKKVVAYLKKSNAPKINGYYVGIIHPFAAADLMSDPEWKYPHQYADPKDIYEGEIGKLAGVRFVESTEAKIFHAQNLAGTVRNLSVNGEMTNTGTVTFDGGAVAAGELADRWVLIGGQRYYVGANTTTTMTLYADMTKTVTASVSCADNTEIYPGEAGAEGRDVYATLVLGDNAYGTTSLENGGLQHIVKQLGSAGTSDPLNQRATAGWKADKVTVRLTEAFMVRIETASTFESGAN